MTQNYRKKLTHRKTTTEAKFSTINIFEKVSFDFPA